MTCTHTTPCRHRPDGLCKTQRSINERAARRAAPADGFEDEFGPAPTRVPDRDWFDVVAVDNLIFGGPSRKLTPPEVADFVRRTQYWPISHVAARLASTDERVWQLRNYHLVIKPARVKKVSA